MKTKNKKICLLFAGGTTISDKEITQSSVNKETDINGWLRQVPEISLMAQVEPVFICANNELTGSKLWQKLSQEIYQRLNEADGFVILTDVESVLTTGIALSFALKNFNKPIILTGSQITAEAVKLADWPAIKAKAYGGLGVKANLINSVQLATMKMPAVALMFGNRVIRAIKAKRCQALGLSIFKSVDESYLGKIDFGISLTEKFNPVQGQVSLLDKFESKIKIINYLPAIDFKDLNNNDFKGAIIRDLPNSDLLKGYNSAVPLMAHNRFLFEQSFKNNVLLINNLTWETALVKFCWALGQTSDFNEIKKLMLTECCQEFI